MARKRSNPRQNGVVVNFSDKAFARLTEKAEAADLAVGTYIYELLSGLTENFTNLPTVKTLMEFDHPQNST